MADRSVTKSKIHKQLTKISIIKFYQKLKGNFVSSTEREKNARSELTIPAAGSDAGDDVRYS